MKETKTKTAQGRYVVNPLGLMERVMKTKEMESGK
jgi:hypothetical protein